MKLAFAIGALLLTATARLEPQAENEPITLGTAALSIGMTNESVKQILSRNYELKASSFDVAGPVESLLVWDGKTPVGNVAFRDGRLLSVFKYWSPLDQQKGVEYAQKFHAAVTSLVSGGHRNCVLSTGSSDQPSSEQRVAFITCGRRSLEVSVLRTDERGSFASLTEKMH